MGTGGQGHWVGMGRTPVGDARRDSNKSGKTLPHSYSINQSTNQVTEADVNELVQGPSLGSRQRKRLLGKLNSFRRRLDEFTFVSAVQRQGNQQQSVPDPRSAQWQPAETFSNQLLARPENANTT